MASEHTWKIKELIANGSLEIGDGYRAKNSELSTRGIPFARAGNINAGFNFVGSDLFPIENLGKVGSKLSQTSDVVFTSKGTVGRFAFVEPTTPQFVYSPQLCYWRSLSRAVIHPRFLYYWMHSTECLDQFEYLKSKTDMADYVNLRDQKEMTISLPEPHLQSAAVDVLAPIDRRIAILLESNATNEAIARTIFKSWFVDFDPVRAKAEGREPEGMDAATASLFPDEFDLGSAGPTPRGWTVSPFSDVSDVIYGAAFASKAFNTERIGLPLIRIRDLKTMKPAVFTDEIHPKGYLVSPGDVVVGMDGEFRSYHWLGEPAWLNQRVCLFRPRNQGGRTFIREALRPLLADVERGQVGTTVIHIGKADIDRFHTIVATPGVMAAFNSLADSLLSRTLCNSEEIRSLTEIRDTLLPRLISGKLRVPEAEKLVEAVL